MCGILGKKQTAAAPVVAAAPPPAPAIPASQSAAAANSNVAAEPVQQIGFARKKENKKRYGNTAGPQGRRNETSTSAGDTGSGIKM